MYIYVYMRREGGKGEARRHCWRGRRSSTASTPPLDRDNRDRARHCFNRCTLFSSSLFLRVDRIATRYSVFPNLPPRFALRRSVSFRPDWYCFRAWHRRHHCRFLPFSSLAKQRRNVRSASIRRRERSFIIIEYRSNRMMSRIYLGIDD